MLQKLPLDMSYSAIGHKFNVNESTMPYIKKKVEKICWSIYEATEEIANITSLVYAEAMEKMEKWLHLWINKWCKFLKNIPDGILPRPKAK